MHWVFAIKYWIVACKLELILKHNDPNQHNLRDQYISVIGLVFNVTAGIMYGIPIPGWYLFLEQAMQLCVVVSCIFLGDAFRRLQKVKTEDQVISKKPIILLFISFGLLGLFEILWLPAYLSKPSTFYKVVRFFLEYSQLISCSTLAFIVFELLVEQYKQE